MKIKLLILLVSLSSLTWASNLKPDGTFVAYYETGEIAQEWQRDNQVLQGPSKRWYRSGELQWEGTYVKGVIQGKNTIYARSGEALEVYTIKNKVRVGKTTYYFRKGDTSKKRIRMTEHYKGARLHGAKTLLLSGALQGDLDSFFNAFDYAFSISSGHTSLDACIAHAPGDLAFTVRNICHLLR